MKGVLSIVLLGIACLVAGLYGAVHNQISYSVAPEYFTEFKFHQFRIDPALRHRVGASIVGWHASWWMGIVIGVVVIPLGWLVRGARHYFFAMLRVYAVIVTTTCTVGLVALAHGYGTLVSPFARAGQMHNFSYLGGLLGIVVGGVCIIVKHRRWSAPSFEGRRAEARAAARGGGTTASRSPTSPPGGPPRSRRS